MPVAIGGAAVASIRRGTTEIVQAYKDAALIFGTAPEPNDPSLAEILADGQANVLALAFLDDFFYGTAGRYGSAWVKDAGTPANNYNSHPFGLLTQTSPGQKWLLNASGVMARHVPGLSLPFEWDIAGNRLGIRVEPAGTQLLLHTQDFLPTFWNKNGGAFTAHAATAPDGSNTGSLWTASSSGAFGSYFNSSTTSASGNISASIVVKKGNQRYCFFDIYGGASDYVAVFDLDTGAYVGNGGWTATTRQSITDKGNGWYRLTVSIDSAAANTRVFGFGTCSGNNVTAVSGDTIYVWGAQFENSAVPTSYIPTKNLILYSQDFGDASWLQEANTIVSNAALAPDGTMTADKLAETTGANAHEFYRNSILTIPAARNVTMSIYAKMAERRYVGIHMTTPGDGGTTPNRWAVIVFDLQDGTVTQTGEGSDGTILIVGTPTITDAGDGWWRIKMTVIANPAPSQVGVFVTNGPTPGFVSYGTGTFYAGTTGHGAYFWGMQVEVGSAATPYSQTLGTFDTRVADEITLPQAAFPWNGGDGVLEVDGVTTTPTTDGTDLVIRPRAFQRYIETMRWVPTP
jgi:hypothetical protein